MNLQPNFRYSLFKREQIALEISKYRLKLFTIFKIVAAFLASSKHRGFYLELSFQYLYTVHWALHEVMSDFRFVQFFYAV